MPSFFLLDVIFFVALSNVQAKVFENATYVFKCRQKPKYAVSIKSHWRSFTRAVTFKTKPGSSSTKKYKFLLEFWKLMQALEEKTDGPWAAKPHTASSKRLSAAHSYLRQLQWNIDNEHCHKVSYFHHR